ncbi:MAG: hypothetical protein ACI94Y_003996, partial [Maribacter sp.]
KILNNLLYSVVRMIRPNKILLVMPKVMFSILVRLSNSNFSTPVITPKKQRMQIGYWQ